MSYNLNQRQGNNPKPSNEKEYKMSKPYMLLWLSDSRGIYIPRDFAKSFNDREKHVANVSNEDWNILQMGPEHEFYWETWDDVLDNAIVTDENSVKYFLHQNGDLWLVPVGMEWDEENETYKWPDVED